MPSNLTDLMERAVASAPPEPHLAHDITRLAQSRQRRRTTFVAAGAALAAVAVTGVVVGFTRGGRDSTPEPVAPPVRMNQHQHLSEAQPADQAQDFRGLDYPVASADGDVSTQTAVAIYTDLDAEGRLLVVGREAGGPTAPRQYRLVEGPAGPVESPTVPPITAFPLNKVTINDGWSTSFTDDQRILWRHTNFAVPGNLIDAQVTDLDGSHTVTVRRNLSDIKADTPSGGASLGDLWPEGERVWFSATTQQHATPKSEGVPRLSLFSFDPAHPANVRPEAARGVLAIDVSGHEAVWITADKAVAEDLTTRHQHDVPIPLGQGCTLPPEQAFTSNDLNLLQTNGALLAVVEYCGETQHILVSDLSGRLVTDLELGGGTSAYGLGLGDRALTFHGVSNGHSHWYVDNLASGHLLALGHGDQALSQQEATAAGPYVLWYDKAGGHVGEFAQ
jgi:hypothetical protein